MREVGSQAHPTRGRRAPLKAIETAEAWTRGQVLYNKLQGGSCSGAHDEQYGDSVYMAAQAARAAAWAVYAEEDGACFRLSPSRKRSSSLYRVGSEPGDFRDATCGTRSFVRG